jgi:hypothetical protein
MNMYQESTPQQWVHLRTLAAMVVKLQPRLPGPVELAELFRVNATARRAGIHLLAFVSSDSTAYFVPCRVLSRLRGIWPVLRRKRAQCSITEQGIELRWTTGGLTLTRDLNVRGSHPEYLRRRVVFISLGDANEVEAA